MRRGGFLAVAAIILVSALDPGQDEQAAAFARVIGDQAMTLLPGRSVSIGAIGR